MSEGGGGLDQVEEELSSVPFVLEGSVLEPDGSPAEGAVVVSSAGGQAVAGPDGRYRLEVRMPLDAESVHVMAVGSSAGSMRASSSISIAPTAGHAWVAPLQLAQEGTCAPSWLPTFGQAPGTDNGLFVLAVFDDGTGSALYMGGPFENPARHIAKWNGTRWEPLGTGIHSPSPLDHTVHALAVYDDGSGSALYVGGLFREAGGTQAHGIARWDGTSWSALGAGTGGAGGGIDESVLALAVYDDGSGSALYAGGDFAELGCDPGNRIARWDGSSWTTLGTGLNGPVEDLAVYDDGGGPALYAGGSFTTAGGLPANRIARWDGSSWSALGSGLSSSVYALTVYDDGSGSALHAGGAFSTAGGVAASRIARWDGSTWTPLGSGMGSNIVRSLAVHDDGSGSALYAGGSFSTAGGVTVNGIARWNGSSWTALGNGVAPLGFWGVPALAVYDDGSGSALYAGGGFSSAGGVAVDGIATWDGSSWSALGSGMGGPIHALAVYDDGGGKALYAGGFFRRAGATAADRVAKWDGSIWSPLGSGVSLGVLCLAVWNDGTGDDLYVGGRFGQAGGMSAGHIAKWDGASWSPLGSGTNAQSEVTCLAVYGPALYVGGDFALAGGNPSAQRIAKWDGTSWSGLGSGICCEVRALAEYDDGSGSALYVGGSFSHAGGVPASGIARWDGSNWTALGSGAGAVHALTVYDDGSGKALYVGGGFTIAGGMAANRIARWDGSSWSALGSGMNGAVYALTVHDDGSGSALYVGGDFTTAGGVAANRIAKWDGSSWTPLGSGMNASVRALEVYDDGDGPALYAGGTFASAIDSGDSYIAKWGCAGPPPPITYCTGKTTTAGCVPFLSHSGMASATSGTFNIFSNDHLEGEIGTYIYSFEKANLNFHGGKLCVKAPIRRVVGLIKTTDGIPCTSCAGNCRTFKRNFNALIQSGIDPLLTPGQSVKVQAQQRDPLDPFVDNLSNGIAFVIGP